MYLPPHSPPLVGPSDIAEPTGADRWHQHVHPLDADAPGGSAVVVGFECDAGVARNGGRTGAQGGPAAIRNALGKFAFHLERDVFDAGSVRVEGDLLEEGQRELALLVAEQLDAGHRPVILGGGHEVAFATWSGLAHHLESSTKVPVVGILNLDAHFDIRGGTVGTSGTPFREIAEGTLQRGWPFHYLCAGISELSNTRALFNRASHLGALHLLDVELQVLNPAPFARFIDDVDLLYLSIDLDVLPGAVMPAVSAPASLGVPFDVVERIVEMVISSEKLAVADIAELNPRFDIDGQGARLAARLAARLLRI